MTRFEAVCSGTSWATLTAFGTSARALSSYPKMLDVIYYQSGPAGEKIRAKAAAVGLSKPAAAIRFE